MKLAAKTLSLIILSQVIFAEISESAAPAEQDAVSVFEIADDAVINTPDAVTKIPVAVIESIKADAAKRYPDDYSTRLFVIEKEKKAFQELTALRQPKSVPKPVFTRVVRHATERYANNYSTRLFVIKKQLKAYQELKSFRPPEDLPKTIFKTIVRKAAIRYPNDYSTLQFVINNQIKAYQKMQSQ